jgi:hypothetical protein
MLAKLDWQLDTDTVYTMKDHRCSLLAITLVASLCANVTAQTGRTLQAANLPSPGSTLQVNLSYPSSAAGNINLFVWSMPYVGSYPVTIPGFSVIGQLRLDAFSLMPTNASLLSTGGAASMSLNIPNTPSILGAALDCQSSDINFQTAQWFFSDNDLEIIVSDRWAARIQNTTAIGNYVRVNDSPSLRPQTFTIDCSFRPLGQGVGGGDGSGTTLIAKPLQGSGGTYIHSWSLAWSPTTNRVVFALSANGSNQGATLTSTGTVATGTWSRATVTVSATMIDLYINGSLDSSTPWQFPSVFYGPQDVLFGAGNYCCGFLRRFDGAIDQASIWNRVLSPAEVGQIATTISTGVGLVGLWNFEGVLTDGSGLANDGFPVGTVLFVPGQ